MTDGRNMKVGDIGVLQNFAYDVSWNGIVAEIIAIVTQGRLAIHLPTNKTSIFHHGGLSVRDVYGNIFAIDYPNIRPLRDPDQTIEQEQTEKMI